MVVEHKERQTTCLQNCRKPAWRLGLRCQTSGAKVSQFVRQGLQDVTPLRPPSSYLQQGRRRQAGTQSRGANRRAPVVCMG